MKYNKKKSFKENTDMMMDEEIKEVETDILVEEQTENEEIANTTKVKVTGALVNLRKDPTRQSKIIKAVIIDTILDISEIKHNDDEWCDYGFVPAENAWINMTYVETI